MLPRLFMLLSISAALYCGQSRAATPANPILFVTQVPVPADFTTVTSSIGNHQATMDAVARGGDLMIRYPDGSVKNLTKAAGFGSSGVQQDAQAIAVREPCVHWSGTKALFSMVIGAPARQYDYAYKGFWQLYEITGLNPGDTPVITKVPNQPATYNNVGACYGTDERIIFNSDRPRDGSPWLYPQRDEYETAPSITGVWSLDPVSADLFLMTHDPSGSFDPIVDSFGRVIFSRWDHLQRDQQADTDALSKSGSQYGTFNYADESATAQILPRQEEVFPEPRSSRTDLLAGTNLNGHEFNQFFPWMINQDGTAEETLNHIGRHELFNYFNASLTDDPNVVDFSPSASRPNQNRIDNMLQIREDPLHPGLYYGIDAPEFATHGAGQIITLAGPPGMNPDQMTIAYITSRATSTLNLDNAAADPTSTGHYRSPTPLSDGSLVAVHSPETRAEKNTGTAANPGSRYDFRIKTISGGAGAAAPGALLTPGFTKNVTWWSPDILVTYNGPLWELDPVEVRPRVKPVPATTPLPSVEQQVFTEESVDIAAFQSYLKQNNLAIIVSRNLTTRDHADKQQPFNLRVAGTATQSVPAQGKIYDISFLQLFQADQLRGLNFGSSSPVPGRRVLATPLHDAASKNPPAPGSPAGSVQLGSDGSMAAFVPARRAMTWQTTAPDGTPVVRERYWLSFQPGEIRTCTSCHGINTSDQANQAVPQNKPEALRTLLQFWKTNQGNTHSAPVLNSPAAAAPNPALTAQAVTFTAAASGVPPLTYAWNFGDGSPVATGASVSHAFAAAGKFTAMVTVSDPNGKSVQGSVSVTVIAAPPNGGPGAPVITAGPTAAPNPAPAGSSVAFSAAATGSGALNYSWNFGDATPVQSGAAVTHAYATPGSYAVAVTVTDTSAKTTSGTLMLSVTDPAPPPSAGVFTVSKAAIVFNFKKSNADSFALSGEVALAANPTSASATLQFGSDSITVKMKQKKARPNKVSTPIANVWSLQVAARDQALFDGVSALGFTKTSATKKTISVPLTLTVDGLVYTSTVPFVYSAKEDKSGMGIYRK